MVAFELAKYFECSGQNEEAAKWYSTAAQRFRRAEWKTKAQEAAVRLGGAASEIGPVPETQQSEELLSPALEPLPVVAMPEQGLAQNQNPDALESAVAVSSEIQHAAEESASVPKAAAGPQRRRRGRRGGKNRRKRGTETHASSASAHGVGETPTARRGLPPAVFHSPPEPTPPRVTHSRAIPTLPLEEVGEPGGPAAAGGPSVKGRYGDPGLSSRISLLEMQFRRLMACPPAKLGEADGAPAGPGVFVLTDADLTSYYYVEACQTLRIAIGNLARGGSRRGVESIKPRLAEHLGIPESRVSKYLTEHCAVRWLQLDEGASNFAHFVIAVLRPTLNE